MLIEPGRWLIDGVHDHEPSRDCLSRDDNACQSVSQQYAAQPSTVECPVKREPCEEDGWDLPGATTSHRLREVFTDQQVARERVVGEDTILVPDEGPACPARLGAERVSPEPLIELGLAAVEPAGVM